MKEKILITGAGGYIGSITTDMFLQDGFEVVGVDNLSTGYREPLKFLQKKYSKGKFRYYKFDLTKNLDSLFSKEKSFKAVVHFAASCSVDESMKNPQKYFSNNVSGSQNLLRGLIQEGVNNIIFSSTCAVYGEAQYIPINENHPINPKNPYGRSKRMVEETIDWYGNLLGLKYVIFRYFNVCGASDDGFLGDSKKPSLLMVQNAVRGALGIEPFYLTCPKVDTPDKTPIRDYINVVDLAKAHLLGVKYLLRGGRSETINLGTEKGNSVLEIVDKVADVTGKKFEIGKAEPRQGEYAKMIASTRKAKDILGWAPKRTLEDSIKSLVVWYQTHPRGWED